MESSNPSGKSSEPPSLMWANFVGSLIAILTLTIPFLAIGSYSSSSNPNLLSPTSYSFNESDTR